MNTKLTFTPGGIKREAKGLLANNWSRALAVVIVMLFALSVFMLLNRLVLGLVDTNKFIDISYTEAEELNTIADYYNKYTEQGLQLDSIITLALACFYFFVVSPLVVGCTGWYQSLAQCTNLQAGQIFYYYRSNGRFIDAIAFELGRFFRHVLFGGICLAPSIVCFGIALGYTVSGNEAVSDYIFPLMAAGGALALAGLIVYALLILRFFVARYMFVADKGYAPGKCFKLSRKFMKGNTGRTLKVIISFIPLFLLCVFIVPLVFVIPYYQAAMAACAQDIIDANTTEQ